jgi:hypothetical protein
MNRREFTKSSLSAAAVGATASFGRAAAESAQHFYELRRYDLRNDLDVNGFHGFLRESHVPSLRELTGGPVGVFTVVSGLNAPCLLLLLQYDSPARLRANTELAASDRPSARAWKEFESSQWPYIRYESWLLKAFAGHPRLEPPAAKEGGHLFELRTYEAKNAVKSVAKIDMFNVEEIRIFRDCGINPVFFGEGLCGPRLPHLTYMAAFADASAREQAWATFRVNPDWVRIRDDPRWVDTVSNSHIALLSSAPYSDIR